MSFVIDAALLLGITKLAIELAPYLSFHTWAFAVALISFGLGMGGAFRSEPTPYVRNYARVVIGQVITTGILVTYITLLAASGLAAFLTLLVVTSFFYVLGRVFGATLRFLPLVFACLLAAWLMAGGRLLQRNESIGSRMPLASTALQSRHP